MNASAFQQRGQVTLLAAMLLSLVLLSSCGDKASAVPTRPPQTGPTSGPPGITVTPGPARIPYPWPMKQRTGRTGWIPVNERVYQELEGDFLAYWAWSGQNGPASSPFLPAANQIPLLATQPFSELQTYIDQIRSSGRVVAYTGARNLIQGQPPQRVQTCTQDGLQCQVYYSFASATKTIYDTQTGKVISRTASITLLILTTQVYNKEVRRWLLNDFRSQEVPG